MTYAYSWARCNSSGATCTPIPVATSTTYLLASVDGGSTMRVTVTATNDAGSTTVTSPPSGVVATPTSTPTVGLGTKLPPRMPESSATKTLYVSPTGSDSNAGTLVAPYHTLGKALLAASSGTVCCGSYGTTQITGRRFDPADPVTVRSYPGERAVFVGQSIYTNAFYLGDCQGIRLRDLTFDAPYDTNIKFDTSQHIELDKVDCSERRQERLERVWLDRRLKFRCYIHLQCRRSGLEQHLL